jgi:cation diffusion facilitator family transporter
MHANSLDQWTHDHVFLGARHEQNERRTWFVVALTVVMMVAEIGAGSMFGSMALFADGWHMATHAAALGIAGLAYLFARQYARHTRFAFGTGKFGELAAFSSAIILLMIAIQIAYESVLRLFSPVPIAYGEAITVASLGLCVNLASAWLLRDSHDHHHGHAHGHAHDRDDDDDDHDQEHDHDDEHQHAHDGHHGHGHDHNLRAAYIHVLADAATSVLAIAALVIGALSGWRWTDPAVGLVGSVVIASWASGLIRDAGAVLLDVSADKDLEGVIRARLESDGDRITDLHLWQVGPGHRAVVISLVSDAPRQPAIYKERLGDLTSLSHVTVEVELCPHPDREDGQASPLKIG